jgi:formate hydrogenlyase subunit 3/multisubunit Na+/H+ antiporter MnhD subunit
MMADTAKEPRNPLYLLLLAASILFVVTALAYAVVPVLEEKAKEAGQMPPPSPFRDALRADGWKWLLLEVAAMMIFGLASMGLDRWRHLKRERAQAGIGSNVVELTSTGPEVMSRDESRS